MLKYLQLQMISMLQSIQCDGTLWRRVFTIIAKSFDMAHSTVYQLWEWAACMCAWVILFLQKLIPEKNSRRPPIYLKDFIQEGVKDVPLEKRCTQRKLATSMGYQRQLCIVELLPQQFVFVVTH